MKRKLLPTIVRFITFCTVEPALDWLKEKKHKLEHLTEGLQAARRHASRPPPHADH